MITPRRSQPVQASALWVRGTAVLLIAVGMLAWNVSPTGLAPAQDQELTNSIGMKYALE